MVPSILERGRNTIAIYDKYESIQGRCKENLVRRTFRVWRGQTIRFMKKDIVEKVDRMDVAYYHSKKRDIFHVLSSLSLGVSSRKKILQRRRDGLARARTSLIGTLSKKNEVEGIITSEMVQRELRKIFHSELYDWNRKRYLEICFAGWKVMFREVKLTNLVATSHLKVNLFKKWRKWTNKQRPIIEGRCHDHSRKLSLAIACNEKIVRQKMFRAWRIKARCYANAARMRRRVLTRFAKNVIYVWFGITKEHRAIKLNTLKEWKSYQQFTLGRPFLSWRQTTTLMRQTRRDQILFLKSYKQVKRRSMQFEIFRTWRHQTRYGRITSMYSRQDLLRLLEEKNHTINELRCQIHDKTMEL